MERFGCLCMCLMNRDFQRIILHLDTGYALCYENYRIAYSFKTNYTPYICSAAKALGAYAEVVSGMEYRLAKQLGYQDKEIIFNGPDKGKDGITAFLHGCMINADSLEELQAYCEEAKTYPEQNFRIGIRVNPAIGQNFVSRFGMDEEDLQTAFQHVSRVPNLKITGLHCHISRCRNLEAWRKRTEYMLGLADRLLRRYSGVYGSWAAECSEVWLRNLQHSLMTFRPMRIMQRSRRESRRALPGERRADPVYGTRHDADQPVRRVCDQSGIHKIYRWSFFCGTQCERTQSGRGMYAKATSCQGDFGRGTASSV